MRPVGGSGRVEVLDELARAGRGVGGLAQGEPVRG